MRLLLLLCVLLLPAAASAQDNDLSRLFGQAGVEGTMVISQLSGQRTYVHDDGRAARRFCPASSFKVFNTLIALEEGVATGKDSALTWDGTRHDIADWNRDQTLESAFKASCVWCYQDMARKVGAEAYRGHIRQAEYGVLPESFDVSTFWLDGSLQVSAVEQVAFLKKIIRRALPFRPESYDILKEVMLAEQADTFKLYAKTGWAARTSPQIGWHVGYVETGGDVWVFATNITMRSKDDLPLRRKLTLDALRAKGILPE